MADMNLNARLLRLRTAVKNLVVFGTAEAGLGPASDELDRKVAERTEELRRTEAYLAEAQRLSHIGSWAFDLATRTIIHSSDEHHRMWGFDRNAGLPKFEEFVQRLHPANRERTAQTMERWILEKTDFEGDLRILLPDGSIRLVHTIGHPVAGESGDVASFVGTTIDVTERRRVEQERQANLWFFESLDRINRAIQGTQDLDQMMCDVLEAVLGIFGCDRACLVYPCDPAAPSWHVSMECTRPEWPGAFAVGGELPMDAEVSGVLRAVLSSSAPVQFGPGGTHAVPGRLGERVRVQSVMGMAIHPKVDAPYMFGVHQCSHPRAWTSDDERLFQEIGRRLADALTARVMLRDLQHSEAKLAEAQRISHVAHWERDLDTNDAIWSDEAFRIFGMLPQKRAVPFTELQESVHADDRALLTQELADALKGTDRFSLEYRVVRPSGEMRVVHSRGDVTRDESGRPRRIFGTIQDITERKRAEAQLEDLAGRLIDAHEEERRRIGRELHDHVSQRLAVLAISTDRLRGNALLPADIGQALDKIYQEADEITAEVHALSHGLHSSIIDQLGLVPALEGLIAESSARHRLHLEFNAGVLSNHVSSDVALCVFRVVEESLANVAKHSGAHAAVVELRDDADGLLLSIEDDGVGFQPEVAETKAGLGFVSMRERLRLIGGTLRVQSEPFRGTRIEARVPSAGASCKTKLTVSETCSRS